MNNNIITITVLVAMLPLFGEQKSEKIEATSAIHQTKQTKEAGGFKISEVRTGIAPSAGQAKAAAAGTISVPPAAPGEHPKVIVHTEVQTVATKAVLAEKPEVGQASAALASAAQKSIAAAAKGSKPTFAK